MMARLREWLLSGLQVCARCGCLADRRHTSGACGWFLRETVTEQVRQEAFLAARVRLLQETQAAHAKLLAELQALTADPFA